MRQIGVEELRDIATGAALMGAGGGGNPEVGKLMAIAAVREHGPVSLLDPSEVPDDFLVTSPSGIGAPAVGLEKFPNGSEFELMMNKLREILGRDVDAVFPIEAGGINSMIPFIVGAKLGLPVVDADGMGRAFPELQMSTLALAGHRICPLILADEKGNLVQIDVDSPHDAEKFARAVTVEMGATSQSVSDTTTGDALRNDGVLGIITKCQKIGHLIRHLGDYPTPASALAALLDVTNGQRMFTAKITDIKHVTKSGFNFGTVLFSGIDGDSGRMGQLEFQNENIVFSVSGTVVATAPDLITLIDTETLDPVTNEELRYGKRVHVLGLPADDKWRTPAGIECVGPRYFKYDIDYQPVEELVAEAQKKGVID
ncbi:hypothetical protein FC50_GL001167 [Lacticaseibacillus pantheris DSM 15945 = JCM 12539 = NBRC 106106]|jgi:DUF917 family protein|uniref:DUF917 domain-containing protein n=1 Tax=Lacticaseibacillus pantheris DSM 15945 = JCM 12539 = NBRC 106106 TaxID=1423783 RepID=A0A0R1TWV8_9LACO|nr:DUF917 domain-containing protein [Lacticaseibacillus pantheris]KRL85776.1 hypothetical protein FC50_GL001167 [Lacticaseibacillus pantheris DSM 15945 = JCM 12539 = NBRC 106106]